MWEYVTMDKNKYKNKLVGIILILISILGMITRTILVGYNNIWDFVILFVFIIVIIIGISEIRGKKSGS